jgi:SAM-dependent methyltransferase
MSIPAEAKGFAAVADAYEQGRPSYPAPAVGRLVEALGIGPGRLVVDLAAGTGKFTRLLTSSGARLVGIEPVEQMRSLLARAVPQAAVAAGTAESIPLASSTVDTVTVAQAFHWFRAGPALAEISRVLRPGGSLGLIWNVRDPDDPLQQGLEAVMARYRGNSPSQASGAWKGDLEAARLFSPLARESFGLEQVVTREQLVSRVVSVSFIGCLGPEERREVAQEVAALAPADEGIPLRYRTDIYWCRSTRGQQR